MESEIEFPRGSIVLPWPITSSPIGRAVNPNRDEWCLLIVIQNSKDNPFYFYYLQTTFGPYLLPTYFYNSDFITLTIQNRVIHKLPLFRARYWLSLLVISRCYLYTLPGFVVVTRAFSPTLLQRRLCQNFHLWFIRGYRISISSRTHTVITKLKINRRSDHFA